MANWYDRAGAIAGDTVRCDGKLVARDVTVTLPEVAAVTAEVNAGGPIDLPITGQTEAMEATITKLGVDADIATLMSHQHHTLEIRAVQDILTPNGKALRSIRAVLGVIPKTIPGISLEFSSIPENELAFSVLSYKLYVDNKEVIYIDKPNNIYRVNGRDFGASVESLL